jgi:drug/metabolite transporter (DMT)-like permease
MRFIKTILTSAGTLLATAATAMAAPLAFLQDPAPIKVDIHTSESHTVWYTDPMWLAIGGIVALLIIVLAIFAARNRSGGSNTTVVR